MMRIDTSQFLIRVLIIFCFAFNSLEFVPEDNYLIDCGSLENTSVGDRVFLADSLNPSFLSTPEKIFINASSNSIPSTYGLALYKTARIFNGTSNYTFSINKKGRHWIRLYFFPFVNQNFNLSTAKFSVFAQSFTLLKDFQPSSVPTVKEYSLNITDNNLVLTFTPSNSFAFLNALEVISLPNELIPSGAKTVDFGGGNRNLESLALETVARVNMGNEIVPPGNDTLWRFWMSDSGFLSNSKLVLFVSHVGYVNYSSGGVTENVAPLLVYGTATKLNSIADERSIFNATWLFPVDPGFDYFVRFHFCNILNPAPDNLYFNVFLNYEFAAKDLNLSTVGVPYYLDAVTRLDNVDQLSISIGSTNALNTLSNGILNGLEIMKISNSQGSLDASDAKIRPRTTTSNSKSKVWVCVGSAIGASIIITILVLVSVLVCRSRRHGHVVQSTLDQYSISGVNMEDRPSKESSIFSQSKRGYRFPFAAVQEATDNFSESLLIGVGGFGKVYKGVLSDGTNVAVKRGVAQSPQGLAEFKTEIEMLSQFRHRHLVSLIGYCDERDELIIIYEYMENGTLKDHLYESGHPKLNWRQRLEISIGSARGLHYLHTGSNKAIIHRDVKSANILLDENLMAKVADFGISKTGPEFDQTHVSTAVKGSFGYLDPEYLTTQQLTDKSDVYSFGVVMIEILCGRPVIDPSQPREMVNLVEWATKCLSIGEVEKIVDPHIANEVKPESLMKFKETAEKCLADFGANRPAMGDVLWNLEFALQLQGCDQRGENNEQSNDHYTDISASTAQYSLGSVGDLAGVSMRRVFSQMVRAENAVDHSRKDTSI